MMQQPTVQNIRIRTTRDAEIVFHAVRLGLVPIVTRRLTTEERDRIRSGDVYVWEERPPHQDAVGMGIERWTDGRKWGPSRVKDDFLFYRFSPQTADPSQPSTSSSQPRYQVTTKQTYSVHFKEGDRIRKWHLTAYFDFSTQDRLQSPSQHHQLKGVRPTSGTYVKAKQSKANGSSTPLTSTRRRAGSTESSRSDSSDSQRLPSLPRAAHPSMPYDRMQDDLPSPPGFAHSHQSMSASPRTRHVEFSQLPQHVLREAGARIAIGQPFAPRTREDEAALAQLRPTMF